MINPRISAVWHYSRCRDGETRIGMEGICIIHSCIPLYTVYMQHIMAHSGGMQEWVIQIPSIPIFVSVLFPSNYVCTLHELKASTILIDKSKLKCL